MPLITGNISEARAAYATLEFRAQAAEQSVTALKTSLDHLSATHQALTQSVGLQVQYTTSQAQINGQLAAQQASQIMPDVSLADFIATLGLAVALGEATMPDRAISSVSVSVQSYLTVAPAGPGNVSKVTGFRLYQPELGAPSALATTSFELTKLAPSPGTPALRSLYSVLQDKQAGFGNVFWSRFSSGTPAVQPAQQIVIEISKIFASIGAWSFPYIIQEAATIAGLETTLAGLLGSSVPAQQAAAFTSVVGALASLTASLNPANRSNFVAGDLFALTASLDATTKIANTLLP
jgi:hypothetical protein